MSDTPKEFRFRSFQPGDEPQILALFEQTFHKPLRASHWAWKFRDNPSGRTYVYLAFDGDRCIGQLAMFAISLHAWGRQVDALIAVDNMVHPDYQGKGVLRQLEALANADRPAHLPFLGFANHNSFHAYTQRFGYTFLGKISVAFKPATLAHLRTRGLHWRVAAPFAGAYRRLYALRGPSVDLVPFDRFGERTDDVWERSKAAYGFTSTRTSEYLNWRFDASQFPYEKYEVVLDGSCIGFVVVHLQERFGSQMCWIMDAFLDPLHSKQWFGAAIAAVEEAVKDRCDWISLLPPTAEHAAIMRSRGYRSVPERLLPHPFYFIVRRNQFPDARILDKRNWYLTWSLHDVV